MGTFPGMRSGDRLSLLVVEPFSTHRESLIETLYMEFGRDYLEGRTRVADSPESAREIVFSADFSPPQIVFVDVQDGEGGVELIRDLRRCPHARRSFVVALDGPEAEDAAMAAGANAFLPKPTSKADAIDVFQRGLLYGDVVLAEEDSSVPGCPVARGEA